MENLFFMVLEILGFIKFVIGGVILLVVTLPDIIFYILEKTWFIWIPASLIGLYYLHKKGKLRKIIKEMFEYED